MVHLLPSGYDVLDVRSVRPTERVKKKESRKEREREVCSREGDLMMLGGGSAVPRTAL